MWTLGHFVGHALGFIADFVIAMAHKPLDRINRVFRIGHSLALGYLPHQPLPGLSDRDHGRRSSPTLLVRDHHWLPALHHGNH